MRSKLAITGCCAIVGGVAFAASAVPHAAAATVSFTSPTTVVQANTPVHVSSVTPCPVGAVGTPSVHLQIRNQTATQFYSQHVAPVNLDGSWSADIDAPLIATPAGGSHFIDAVCYNDTASTLAYQSNPLQVSTESMANVPPGTFTSPIDAPAGSTATVSSATLCPAPNPDLLNVTRFGVVWVWDEGMRATITSAAFDVKVGGTWTTQVPTPRGPVVSGTAKDYKFVFEADCWYRAPDGQELAIRYSNNDFTLTDPVPPADPAPSVTAPTGAGAATGSAATTGASGQTQPSRTSGSTSTADAAASPDPPAGRLASTGKSVGETAAVGIAVLLLGYVVALRARERFRGSPYDILPKRRLERWRI